MKKRIKHNDKEFLLSDFLEFYVQFGKDDFRAMLKFKDLDFGFYFKTFEQCEEIQRKIQEFRANNETILEL